MPFGAHMSVAGGLHKCFERGEAVGCDVIQIFTKNTNQWAAKPITEGEQQRFLQAWAASPISVVVAHDSYLINLASPDLALRRKSIEAFRIEMERCELLGIPFLVTHPGAHVGSGEEAGLRTLGESLNELHGQTKAFKLRVLLETTAGQGSSLGHRLEHLARFYELVEERRRLGVCLDTCHLFAAGYDIARPAAVRRLLREVDGWVGLGEVEVVHVNDSKGQQGSRLDRHAHIGEGAIGLEGFRALVNAPSLRKLPFILETPKEGDADVRNLATLRGLLKPRPSRGAHS